MESKPNKGSLQYTHNIFSAWNSIEINGRIDYTSASNSRSSGSNIGLKTGHIDKNLS
jgi:hypothetical protein